MCEGHTLAMPLPRIDEFHVSRKSHTDRMLNSYLKKHSTLFTTYRLLFYLWVVIYIYKKKKSWIMSSVDLQGNFWWWKNWDVVIKNLNTAMQMEVGWCFAAHITFLELFFFSSVKDSIYKPLVMLWEHGVWHLQLLGRKWNTQWVEFF